MDILVNLKNAHEIIYSLNLTNEIKYLVNNGWNENDAINVAKTYQNYLFLLVKFPEKKPVPSFEIQMLWSGHILNIDSYLEFRDKLNKASGINIDLYRTEFIKREFKRKEDKYNFNLITKPLYKQEFGVELRDFRNSSFVVWVLDYLKKHNVAFICIFLTLASTTIVNKVKHENDNLISTHALIKDVTRDLTYTDEVTYMVCNSSFVSKENPFYLNLLFNTFEARKNSLRKYIKIVRLAHEDSLITNDAYNALSDFGKWNNDLYKRGLNMCTAKLKDMDELAKVREKLIETIDKSKDKQLVSLKYIILLICLFFIIMGIVVFYRGQKK